MFALLGDIQFDLITYFDGFESQFAADYAEHAVIEGKPRLQWMGDRLDEIRIQLSFHAQYCDPERELLRLKSAKEAHQAQALVLGNGDYKGWFVLTEIQAVSKQTDKAGTLIALEATVTLREFVGDKKNPLLPPAILPKLPPVAAKTLAAVTSPLQSGTAGMLRSSISKAVIYTRQAQSAMRSAVNAGQAMKTLRDNPVAALAKVPGLLGNLQQTASPLAQLIPTMASLSATLPQAATLLDTANKVANGVRTAQGEFGSLTGVNISSRMDAACGQLEFAAQLLDATSSGISRLAATVVTRKA